MTYINMDHAAAAPLLPEVFEAMRPYFVEEFGNPSSIHPAGTAPREALDRARENTAALIGATPGEIVFTSCGSEANNLALKGIALAGEKRGRHIVVSAIEHQSVLNAGKALARMGWEISTVGVDAKGFVDPDAVADAVRPDTVLVSVTHASNEIGTIEPVREIAARVKEKGALFHTDAIQTAGTIPVDVNDLGVDLLTLSANAFYGPKGAAALYVRKGARLFSLVDGGIQERGRRAGTENIPAYAGMGKAAELALRDMTTRRESVTRLRDRLMRGLEERIPKLIVNGDRERRLPGNVHISVEAVEGESLLFSLAGKGVLAASGSSCADKALKTSHVLTAIGLEPAIANGSVLFSLGFENTGAEVDHVLGVLPAIAERLRSMSPFWGR